MAYHAKLREIASELCEPRGCVIVAAVIDVNDLEFEQLRNRTENAMQFRHERLDVLSLVVDWYDDGQRGCSCCWVDHDWTQKDGAEYLRRS
jgi:hypothetical protein